MSPNRIQRTKPPTAVTATPTAAVTAKKPKARKKTDARAVVYERTRSTKKTAKQRPAKTDAPAAAGTNALAARLLATTQDPAQLAALTAMLQTPAGKAVAIAQVKKLTATLAAADPDGQERAKVEAQLIGLLAQLTISGQLPAVLRPLAEIAWEKGALPPAGPEEREVMVAQLAGMIETILRQRGLTPDSQGTRYVTWEEMKAVHLGAVRGETAAIRDPEFAAQLEHLIGVPLAGANARLLVNGTASFAERDRMIAGARESIYLTTWAVYDDATGRETTEQLKAALARGVDVRVMVDDEVAKEPAHARAVARLREAGIPVVRVPGHHRKVFIVDRQEGIVGGINIGDVYAHRGEALTDAKKQWRDTDVLLTGPVLAQALALTERLWNENAPRQDPPLEPIRIGPAVDTPVGGARAAVVDDAPGMSDRDPVLLGILKGIESARETIDIENAYFILNPALREALLAAIARGVQVRILSNSAESVDVPIISAPILESLAAMREAGAEVYLKTGATLHSKFLVADGRYVSLGSYNLHPQSQRFKGETNVVVVDDDFAAQTRAAFEADIAAAKRLGSAAELKIPKSALTTLVTKLFFDFL